MSLLEKVRLVKKKEEKPEEELPAEESKPRENRAIREGAEVGQAALCLGNPALGSRQLMRSSTREG